MRAYVRVCVSSLHSEKCRTSEYAYSRKYPKIFHTAERVHHAQCKKKKKSKTEEGVAPLYLYFAHFARAVHPAGHVDSVPPDVVLRFPSPNDPGYHGAVVYPCTEDDRAVS